MTHQRATRRVTHACGHLDTVSRPPFEDLEIAVLMMEKHDCRLCKGLGERFVDGGEPFSAAPEVRAR